VEYAWKPVTECQAYRKHLFQGDDKPANVQSKKFCKTLCLHQKWHGIWVVLSLDKCTKITSSIGGSMHYINNNDNNSLFNSDSDNIMHYYWLLITYTLQPQLTFQLIHSLTYTVELLALVKTQLYCECYIDIFLCLCDTYKLLLEVSRSLCKLCW